MLEHEKITLRKALRQQRAQLTREQVTAAAATVARQILACDAFCKAKSVMGFLAFGKELGVDAVLAAALAMGKTVAVPYIVSDTSFVKSFRSAGFEFPSPIAAVEEYIPEDEETNLVRACPPNEEINNCEIIELPVVFNSNFK